MPFGITQEKGRPIAVKDEGVAIATNVGSIDFAGGGVSGAAVGSDVTETIPGGSGTIGEKETLTNTGDDTNFTFANTPTAVYVVWAAETGQVITDYSVVGDTLTLTSAMPGYTIKATYAY